MRTFVVYLLLFLAVLASMALAQDNFTVVPTPNAQNMALSADATTLYIATAGSLYVIDVQTQKQTKTCSLGNGQFPISIAVHPTAGIVMQMDGYPSQAGPLASTSYTIIVDPGSCQISPLIRIGVDGQWYFGNGDVAIAANGDIYLSSNIYNGANAPNNGGGKIAVLNPVDLSVTKLFYDVSEAAQYIVSVDGQQFMTTFASPIALANGAIDSYLGFVQGLSVVTQPGNPELLELVNLPISPAAKPVISPDGSTAYVWGNNCGLNCPSPVTWGMAVINMATQQMKFLNFYPTDLAFSGKENTLGYVMTSNGVASENFTSLVAGNFNTIKEFDNPDGSIGNRQLLVVRNEFTDTLIVLQANQILLWDVPRTAPVISSVVDSATFTAGCAPESWCTELGGNLGFQPTVADTSQQPANDPFPQQVSDGMVSLKYANASGQTVAANARMNYESPSQTNFLMPADVPVGGSVTVTHQTQTSPGTWTASSPVQVPIVAAKPGIFAVVDYSTGAVVVPSQTGAYNGDTLVIYGSALGPVGQPTATGQPATQASSTLTLPNVTIGGISAIVQYSGLAPGLVGCYQLNIIVPQVASGMQNINISADGVSTTPAARVLIQQSQQ